MLLIYNLRYFPWLNLGHTHHPAVVCTLKWMIWVLAGLGIIYQQVRLALENPMKTFNKFYLFFLDIS